MRKVFESKEYLDNLKTRLISGDADRVELGLLHMVYGKPKETVELPGNSLAEIVQMAFMMRKRKVE